MVMGRRMMMALRMMDCRLKLNTMARTRATT
jgi:hypothetical protein